MRAGRAVSLPCWSFCGEAACDEEACITGGAELRHAIGTLHTVTTSQTTVLRREACNALRAYHIYTRSDAMNIDIKRCFF